MKATVTQINADSLEKDWRRLKSHLAENNSDFLLLPEMCFAPWFCAEPARDERVWQAAVAAHETWLQRLPELPVDIIAGSAPRNIAGKPRNVAYVWTRKAGWQWTRSKTYLPKDEGFWEANWYDRGPVNFPVTCLDNLSIGFLICTELWFMQHAREYAGLGAHLLLVPRSTGMESVAKWLAGGQAAAVISGAFCLSSNHAGKAGGMRLGGAGWICDPDGALLAKTSEAEPFVTRELDLNAAEAAKSSYPRYVDDSPI